MQSRWTGINADIETLLELLLTRLRNLELFSTLASCWYCFTYIQRYFLIIPNWSSYCLLFCFQEYAGCLKLWSFQCIFVLWCLFGQSTGETSLFFAFCYKRLVWHPVHSLLIFWFSILHAFSLLSWEGGWCWLNLSQNYIVVNLGRLLSATS